MTGGGYAMGILGKLLSLIKSMSESEVRDFQELLKVKFGFSRFIYTTSEGLLILGNFEDNEELSAKVPEMLKLLSELEDSTSYLIQAGEHVYSLVKITDDVLMLGKGNKILDKNDINALIRLTKDNFKL